MVSSPVINAMKIPEAVNPPIPGESHRYYGNIHLKQLKLPSNSFTPRGNTTSYPRYSEDGLIEGDLDIHEAAAAGNLTRVKELLAPQGSGETYTDFVRANVPSSSGLTPLHYAASRGHYDVVRWLIDAGAIVDLEDQTGETALLKASYNGHSPVVAFLLQKDANVSQRDSDGWTALHNASAQGCLKIVLYLVEHTKADVNVKSSKGYTPLMNAASKGNIRIVKYLLEHHANPLIKNGYGETAYDVAAISQEIYICELLEKSEREWCKGKRSLPEPTSIKELEDMPNFDQPYDIYTYHNTVPIIIHENQRSASAFGLSLRGSQKYSAANLLKNDTRGPWSFPGGKPISKEDINLSSGPMLSTASVISNVASSKTNNSWYWASDWQIDMTYPNVDAQGWQYARSFDENDWYTAPSSNNGNWVRRRRWVAVMKRRTDENVLQCVSNNNAKNGIDYIGRAEAIIKKVQDNKSVSEVEQLAHYKEAIEILISGSKSDNDPSRKQEANSLANSLMSHAEHLDNRINGIDTGTVPTSPSFKDVPMTPILPKSTSPTPFGLDFHVNRPSNVTPPITNLNAPSTTSLKSNETFDSPWNNTVQSDDIVGNNTSVFGDLSPTRAHAQLGLTVTNVQANSLTTPFGKWENDEDVHECRRCKKKFGLWIRRHHCRRCGQVVCDKCSTGRVNLPPNQVLTDPSQSGEASQSSSHRVCDSCKLLDHMPRPRSSSFTSTTVVSSSSSTNHRRRTSNNSTITECPSCNTSLTGGKSAQEHISKCLENRGGGSVSGHKYVGEQND